MALSSRPTLTAVGLAALVMLSQQQAPPNAGGDSFAMESSLLTRLQGPPSPRPLPPGLLSHAFGSHMVLQRAPKAAVLWGAAPAATAVRVTFRGNRSAPISPGRDGSWRFELPPTAGGAAEYTIAVEAAPSGATVVLTDVVFGDVYIAGGQSNMAFSLPANIDFDTEQAAADARPLIRLFTVGTAVGTLPAPGARGPQPDLAWYNQGWTRASAASVGGCNPVLDARCMSRVDKRFINCSGATNQLDTCSEFGYFSAVAWFFGKRLHDELNGTVPIGLISANWGGTALESWATSDAFQNCGGYKGCRGCRCATPAGRDGNGALYNSIIAPLARGPMAISGFVWYQGEANTATLACAKSYACLFPAMIDGWRAAFAAPDVFFGFVQLSTFGCTPIRGWTLPLAVPQLRDAQMAAAKLHNVGWVTNADLGAGCNVHPPRKATVGARLANAALGLIYSNDSSAAAPKAPWRSPSYKRMVATTATTLAEGTSRAVPTAAAAAAAVVTVVAVTVQLNDPAPLKLVYPPNYAGLDLNSSTIAGYPAGNSGNCSGLNRVMPGVCAWAAVELTPVTVVTSAARGEGGIAAAAAAAFWINATASPGPGPDHDTVVLTAPLPAGTTLAQLEPMAAVADSRARAQHAYKNNRTHHPAVAAAAAVTVTGTAYGYGPIPIMSLYTTGSSLPVLPWNSSSEVKV